MTRRRLRPAGPGQQGSSGRATKRERRPLARHGLQREQEQGGVPRAVTPWRGVVRGGDGGTASSRRSSRRGCGRPRPWGDIREVQKLVESGVDVNSQNEVNGCFKYGTLSKTSDTCQ
uniref:Uncharacterized protein n=1 Tax=Rangifer tarandus platyrhynchus TaxID=3082113 RepID=A0ACB0FB82_RANTA|nr:unnamed protein product [Rangifer tarandus platyrhynchus]